MFSVDPDVYGQDIDLAANARRLEDDLRQQVQALAAEIVPPFTPARTRAIRAAAEAVRAQARRLGQLCNRFVVESRGQSRDQPQFLRLGSALQRLEAGLDALDAALRDRGRPLLADHHHPGAVPAPGDATLERLFERLHLALMPDVPVLTYGTAHGDIPLPIRRFQALMEAATRLLRAMERPEPWSFLDVGCGIGLKVLAAQEYFTTTAGIELNADRAAVAGRLTGLAARNRQIAQDTITPWVTGTLPAATARIEAADALTWQGYGAFDVIYAYRPIFDTELMTELDRRIAAQARPGAILIMPYGDFLHRGGGEGLVTLNDYMFLKPAPGLKPANLLRRAADIGPLRPVPPFGGYRDEGFAAPLLAALRRWGHLD